MIAIITSTRVYVSCFLLLLGFNILFTLYPARTIGDIVNLAPMIDLEQESLVGAIDDVSQRLSDANQAIRFGNFQGIKTGADARNEAHNRIMYAKGCPWREDPTNCTMVSKPQAADSGLLFLANTLADSLRSVVMRYAGDTQPDDLACTLDAEGHEPARIEHVRFSPERAALIKSDVDVAFLQENFQGDMTEGFRHVMRMFSADAGSILAVADGESELLYAVFMILIIGCYHITLFRRTIRIALAEVDKAKEFVWRQPFQVLEEREHEVFASFFTGEDFQLRVGSSSRDNDRD